MLNHFSTQLVDLYGFMRLLHNIENKRIAEGVTDKDGKTAIYHSVLSELCAAHLFE